MASRIPPPVEIDLTFFDAVRIVKSYHNEHDPNLYEAAEVSEAIALRHIPESFAEAAGIIEVLMLCGDRGDNLPVVALTALRAFLLGADSGARSAAFTAHVQQ